MAWASSNCLEGKVSRKPFGNAESPPRQDLNSPEFGMPASNDRLSQWCRRAEDIVRRHRADAPVEETRRALEALAGEIGRRPAQEPPDPAESLGNPGPQIPEEVSWAGLFEALPIPALVVYADGRIEQANPRAMTLFEFETARPAAGEGLARFVTAEQARRLTAAAGNLRPGGRERLARLALRLPSGTAPVEAHLLGLPATGDPPARRLLVMLVDRSALAKLARRDAELRASEAKFRVMTDWTADWEYWTTQDGIFVHMTPSSEAVTGYPPEAFSADPKLLERIVHPSDLRNWRAHVATHLLSEGEGLIQEAEIEFRIFTPERTTRWVSHRCRPLFDEAGGYLGRRVSVRDITEHKQAQERIRTTEEQVRRLGDNLPQGAIYQQFRSIDGQNRFPYISSGVERLLGVSPRQVMADARVLLDRIHPDSRASFDAAQEASARTLQAFDQIVCHRLLGGQLCWVHWRAQPGREADGSTRWDGLILDVTAQHKAEIQLQQARQSAEAASRAKTVFLANMSHELRTPLNGVLGYVQILTQDAALDERQRRSVKAIGRSAAHLLRLLNEVLELADLDSGGLQLHIAPFFLPGLLHELIDAYRRQTPASITLRLEAEKLPERIFGDRGRLYQVLDNLLENAVKFSLSGTVLLTIQAEPSAAERVVLTFLVADQGPGIPPDDMGCLLQPFRKVTGSLCSGGTGLGLHLCHALISRMNGQFGVLSKVAGGRWAGTDKPPLPVPEREQGTAAWFRIEVEAMPNTEWRKWTAAPSPVADPALEPPLIPEIVDELRRLCAAGDIDALLVQADRLRPGCPDCAQHLRELTETMQLDELDAWLREQ